MRTHGPGSSSREPLSRDFLQNKCCLYKVVDFYFFFSFPPAGLSDSETWMLASSTCELLHPHRLGAHEQPQQWPQSPADLPLHQVRVDPSSPRQSASGTVAAFLNRLVFLSQRKLPVLPDGSRRLEEQHPTQLVLQQQLQ